MLGLPELLVLDEPTNGLDPPQIAEMREVLQRVRARPGAPSSCPATCWPRWSRPARTSSSCTRGGSSRPARSTRSPAPAACSWRSPTRPRRRGCSRPPASASELVPARRALEDVFLDLIGEDSRDERARAIERARGSTPAAPLSREREVSRWRRPGAASTTGWPCSTPGRAADLRPAPHAAAAGRVRPPAQAAPHADRVRAAARPADHHRHRVPGRRRRPGPTRRSWSGSPPRGGFNFALFTEFAVGRLPARRRGRAVLRRHGGQRGELVVVALPAGPARAALAAAAAEADRRPASLCVAANVLLPVWAFVVGGLFFGWSPARSPIGGIVRRRRVGVAAAHHRRLHLHRSC